MSETDLFFDDVPLTSKELDELCSLLEGRGTTREEIAEGLGMQITSLTEQCKKGWALPAWLVKRVLIYLRDRKGVEVPEGARW